MVLKRQKCTMPVTNKQIRKLLASENFVMLTKYK